MDWYSMSAADAVGKLSSSVDRGLSSREAEKRLGQDGETYCAAKRKKYHRGIFRAVQRFHRDSPAHSERSVVCDLVLEEHGDFADPIMILIIVILNAAVGVIQQRRAEHSLEALKICPRRRRQS